MSGENDVDIKVGADFHIIDRATAALKRFGHAAVGTQAETKASARGFRRIGSALALMDTSLGTSFFKMSRIAMTMGVFGVGLAGVAGGLHFLVKGAKEAREEWDKHIATIGTVKDEYDQYLDTIATKKDAMARFGISFDETYVNYVKEIAEGWDAAHRKEKIADASAKAYIKSLADVSGGMDKLKGQIDATTQQDIWRTAIDSTNEMYGCLADIFKILAKIQIMWDSFWLGINTDVDTFASKQQEFVDDLDKQIRDLKSARDAGEAFDEGSYNRALTELEAKREAVLKGDTAYLKTHGQEGWGKALTTLKLYEDTKLLTELNSIGDTVKQIEQEERRHPTTTVHLAPTGVWSTNMQGGIPYANQKVPISDLTGLETVSGISGLTGATTLSAVNSGLTVTPTYSLPLAPTAGASTIVEHLTCNFNQNINIDNIKDPLLQDAFREIAHFLAQELGAVSNSAGDAF